jgi:urea transporter
VVEKRYTIVGELVPLLRRAARLGDVLAIFVFGLLFCIFHARAEDAPLVLTPTEWTVVAIVLGGALGVLFRTFLAGDESENGRFLALVGIITFASGAAWFLSLSGFLVNLVLGAVLMNTARAGKQIRATLERTEVPMHLVLLVFAGALWQPPPLWATVAAGCGFIALRLFGKRLGAALAGWGHPIRGDLHRGLMGHGVVTVAMAISFRLVYDGAAVDIAYTVILASVVLHHLAAPRALRALLVDAGELERERSPG